MNNKDILVEMIFGSQLYGTASANSDTDLKGVYLPSKRDMYLGRIPKSINLNTKTNSNEKNTAEDVDREFYSLQYFFELAKKGETVALDMLHAPASAWKTHSYEWNVLVSKRHLFNTKSLNSLVGYARKQAAKYGVKGSRLAEVKDVLNTMNRLLAVNSMMRVRDAVGVLPKSENCGLDGEHYNVCGRKLTMGAYLHHYVPMLENFIKEYGERAKLAEANEGVDWKAISHAFRAAYQVKALLTHGDFTYPLAETSFIRKVKMGELHFKNEVAPILDDLMSEIDALATASSLPEKVDEKAADALLLDLIHSRMDSKFSL